MSDYENYVFGERIPFGKGTCCVGVPEGAVYVAGSLWLPGCGSDDVAFFSVDGTFICAWKWCADGPQSWAGKMTYDDWAARARRYGRCLWKLGGGMFSEEALYTLDTLKPVPAPVPAR